MNYHDKIAHLLGATYDDGNRDCYGLLRRYYADVYGIEMPNLARSAWFFSEGVDLIPATLLSEGFEVIEAPLNRLEVGDGLLLRVPHSGWPTDSVNHLGVMVGNGMMLHHAWKQLSEETPFSNRWQSRVMTVVRHPEVTEKNKALATPINVLDLLPDHVKRKHGIEATPILGTDG